MAELITDFSEAQQQADDDKPVTQGQLRQILSGISVGEILSHANLMAIEVNNTQFHLAALMEFLAKHGLECSRGGVYYLDPIRFNEFLRDAVDKRNAAVPKPN